MLSNVPHQHHYTLSSPGAFNLNIEKANRGNLAGVFCYSDHSHHLNYDDVNNQLDGYKYQSHALRVRGFRNFFAETLDIALKVAILS